MTQMVLAVGSVRKLVRMQVPSWYASWHGLFHCTELLLGLWFNIYSKPACIWCTHSRWVTEQWEVYPFLAMLEFLTIHCGVGSLESLLSTLQKGKYSIGALLVASKKTLIPFSFIVESAQVCSVYLFFDNHPNTNHAWFHTHTYNYMFEIVISFNVLFTLLIIFLIFQAVIVSFVSVLGIQESESHCLNQVTWNIMQ